MNFQKNKPEYFNCYYMRTVPKKGHNCINTLPKKYTAQPGKYVLQGQQKWCVECGSHLIRVFKHDEVIPLATTVSVAQPGAVRKDGLRPGYTNGPATINAPGEIEESFESDEELDGLEGDLDAVNVPVAKNQESVSELDHSIDSLGGDEVPKESILQTELADGKLPQGTIIVLPGGKTIRIEG